MGSDDFLTVAEIAELFRLNQQTVRNWIDSGELVAIRLGRRRVRVRRANLDAFIEASSSAISAPGTDDTKARAELEVALDRTRAALDAPNRAALVAALRDLSSAARRLERRYAVRAPSRATRA